MKKPYDKSVALSATHHLIRAHNHLYASYWADSASTKQFLYNKFLDDVQTVTHNLGYVLVERDLNCRVDEILDRCFDFIDKYADIVDGPDGQEPNEALQLIRELNLLKVELPQ